ncbi:MAG: hypothetical protein IT354_12485 [Gemmatimonadaceae bacterium]|nr:hypothetical protein [Gemmatimonadaceae bacterium]
MKRVWTALGLVLALTAFMPRATQAQSTRDKKPKATVGQNYPNPFNPETTIPFTVGDPPTCTDNGAQYRVSMKIYNMLSQLVAVPVVQSGGASLENVNLPCGSYKAFWDGKVLNTGREAASGVYYFRLEVNGVAIAPKKMILVK